MYSEMRFGSLGPLIGRSFLFLGTASADFQGALRHVPPMCCVCARASFRAHDAVGAAFVVAFRLFGWKRLVCTTREFARGRDEKAIAFAV